MNSQAAASETKMNKKSFGDNSPISASKKLLQSTIIEWRLNRLKPSLAAGIVAESLSNSLKTSPKEKKEISWDQIVVGCRVSIANQAGIVVRKATYHSVENIVDEAGDLPADFSQTTEQCRFVWLIMEGRFEHYKLVELSEIYDLEPVSHEMLLTHENQNVRAFGRTILNKTGEEVLLQWIESGRYNELGGEALYEKDILATFPSESTAHNINLAKEIGRTPDKKRLLEIFIKLQNAYACYTK